MLGTDQEVAVEHHYVLHMGRAKRLQKVLQLDCPTQLNDMEQAPGTS